LISLSIRPVCWTTPTPSDRLRLDVGWNSTPAYALLTASVPDFESNGANALLPMPELYFSVSKPAKKVTGGPPPFFRL